MLEPKSLAAIKDECRRVLGLILGRPLKFNWVIVGELAWTSKISSSTELNGLWKRGIRAILTLTEDPIPARAIKGRGMTLMHCPIADHAPPTIDQIKQCVVFIHRSLLSHRSVAVHCKVGKGRSGTIIAAYLMKRYSYAPSHAIRLMREFRPNSIEPNQELALIKYYETLKHGKSLETQ